MPYALPNPESDPKGSGKHGWRKPWTAGPKKSGIANLVDRAVRGTRGPIVRAQRGILFYPRAWRILFTYNCLMVGLLLFLPPSVPSWAFGLPNLLLAPAAISNGKAWWKTALLGGLLLLTLSAVTSQPKHSPNRQIAPPQRRLPPHGQMVMRDEPQEIASTQPRDPSGAARNAPPMGVSSSHERG